MFLLRIADVLPSILKGIQPKVKAKLFSVDQVSREGRNVANKTFDSLLVRFLRILQRWRS